MFKEQQAERAQGSQGSKAPAGSLTEIFARQWRPMLICVGIVLAFNVNNYTVTAYLPSYLETELGYSGNTALVLSLGAMALMLLTVTVVGRMSDSFGRRTMLRSGSICAIVLTLPAFWMLQHGSMVVVVLGTLLLAVTLVHFSGTVPSTLPALFPTHARYGALAISFNVSVALFGGTTPLLAEALVETTSNLYSPAVLVIAAGVVGLITALVMRESANRPLPEAAPAVAK